MYALYDLLFIRFMRPNWTEDLRIYHRETMAIPIPMHIVMRKDTNYTILVRPGHYFPFAEAHCQCKHCSRKCQNIKRNNNINLTSAARSVRWLGGVKGGVLGGVQWGSENAAHLQSRESVGPICQADFRSCFGSWADSYARARCVFYCVIERR